MDVLQKDDGGLAGGNAKVTETFPARIYDETVLAINFEDAKRYFLDSLLEIHHAHTLMLCRQRIIGRREAKACLEALGHLDRDALAKASRDGCCEDLFFHIEQCLLEECGDECAGKMHTARSRNDIDVTMYRMVLRREILELAEGVMAASQILLGRAGDHLATLMPAYTHTQPAQPTTFAHYLMAAVEFLERDIERLRALFDRVNRSPLGACAITTTGFPIDREYTAQLLGFEGLQLNSYGAIAAVDYLTEAAAVVAVAMINLGRLVQDLLLWCSEEFGFLRLNDAYVQVSSIMPQKRNPVALEHTRVLASKALGQAQAVLTCAHNTPFGDTVDAEDDVQPLARSMFADASRAVRLFTGLVAVSEADKERLRRSVSDRPLTVTELADTLVRKEGLSFRQAHRLVSQAVQEVASAYTHRRMVAALKRLAPGIIQRRLKISDRECMRALDPSHFIQVRTVAGGPALNPMQAAVARARTVMASNQVWLKRKQQALRNYPKRIRQAVAALNGSAA
jgi:argininosuccinate lyase